MVNGRRDRAEGWKHAKLSGHENEKRVCELLASDIVTQKRFLDVADFPDAKIVECSFGGLREENVPSIIGEGKKTKSKVDMSVKLSNGKTVGVSIKKSAGGQVYLIGVEKFIDGMETHYGKKIPESVRRAMRLYWGSASDAADIIERFSSDEKIKKYELRKHRLTAGTLLAYDKQLYDDLLEWFKENIGDIMDFCFSRGQAKNASDWADVIWYKNMIGENDMDAIYHIDELCEKAKGRTEEICRGTRGGGTTICLPFGFVQWHKSSMQFHHNMRKLLELSE